MALSQQWSSRFKVDQITALTAKADDLLRAIDNMSMNAAFNNSEYQAFRFGPPKSYIAPVVSDFMHAQGKMNRMIFEQLQRMQTMSAQLFAQNKSILERMDHQSTPSQPEVNPRGEVKAITLRSGTYYQGAANPTDSAAQHTDRADSTRTVQNSPDAETEHPHRVESTRPAQVEKLDDMDRVSLTQPVHISIEGQKTKQAGTPPPYRQPVPSYRPLVPSYRPPVPFPRRLAKSILNEQFANFIQVLKQLHITIPFTDALIQLLTYTKVLKDILKNILE